MSYRNKGSMPTTALITSLPDRSGNLVCNGADDDVEINSALASYLTSGRDWQERVLLQGDFTIEDTIFVPPYTILELDGNVTLASSSDCDMVRNLNYAAAVDNPYITIRGGYWFGDGDNQASGGGFALHGGGANYMQRLKILDLNIQDIQDDILSLQYITEYGLIQNVNGQRTRDGRGVYANYIYDSKLLNVNMSLIHSENFLFDRGESNQFDTLYAGGYASGAFGATGGQFVLDDFHNNQFTNVIVDSSYIHSLVLTDASYHNQFTNLRVSRQAFDGAKKDAILLDTDSIENTFTNVYIGERDEEDDTGINFDIAIRELNNADYNIFTNVQAYDCDAYYALLGVNSRIRHSYPRTENRGVATILNGNASIVTAHGLVTTPRATYGSIRVAGTHAEVESCYVDTVGAANFTIHKGGAGNVTANRDVYWEADW